MDASYDVKELYVHENKLDLAKADADTLPAVQIGKVQFFCSRGSTDGDVHRRMTVMITLFIYTLLF